MQLESTMFTPRAVLPRDNFLKIVVEEAVVNKDRVAEPPSQDLKHPLGTPIRSSQRTAAEHSSCTGSDTLHIYCDGAGA